ncbi:MAG: oligosaccharide flippase family protein [Anaerolineae bacterium]|nr:oligosaccharide flippase family protein [Anaerolineae bacterium]
MRRADTSLWRRILQGMTAFSADTLISNLAAVLSAALVFRYLDVSAYGRLTLALSFYTSATIFLDFGLGSVCTAEVARARGGGNLGWAKFLLTSYLWLNVITGCGGLMVFLLVGYGWRDPLWTVMGFYLLTTALNGVISVLFHSYTRYRRLAAQSIIRSLSRLLLLALLPLWWRGEALLGVAWTYPLMDVIALLMAAWLVRRALRDLRDVRVEGYSLASLGVLFRQQGIYATLSVPVKRIADQLPVWFLKALVGDTGVGIYGAAQKGFSLLYAFFSALETTIFPLVSEQIEVDRERLRIALRHMQKYTFWLGLVVAVLGGLGAHWLILLVEGPKYLAAVPVFRLMLWQLVIYAFLQPQRPMFYALGLQKWLLALYLFNSLTQAVVLPMAISAMGIIGTAWALLFYAALSAVTRMLTLRRLDPWTFIDPRSVFVIDGFDRRLWHTLQAWLMRRSRDGGVSE